MADLLDKPTIRLYLRSEREAPRLVPSPAARRWYWPNAYRCLPLVAAGQLGWTVLSPVSFMARWDGSPDRRGLVFSQGTPHGTGGLDIRSLFGYGILSITLQFYLRTSAEIDLLIKGVPNAPKDGVCALEGLVETDWFDGAFAANLRLTRPGIVRWAEGEPLFQILPYPRGWLERFRTEVLTDGPDHAAVLDAGDRWNEDRRKLYDLIRRGERPYDRQYRRGTRHDGGHAPPTHRTRLRVPPFASLEPAPHEF